MKENKSNCLQDEIVSEDQSNVMSAKGLPAPPTFPPPRSPRVASLVQDDDDEDTESVEEVSEWEVERMKQKVRLIFYIIKVQR